MMRARWQQTREAFTRGWYAAEGVEADISGHLAAMRAGTRLYPAAEVHRLSVPAAAHTTRFEVTGESTLQAAARLAAAATGHADDGTGADTGKPAGTDRDGDGGPGARRDGDGGAAADVAALNFASARNPGGGVVNGARAQEESLARSSALYDALVRCPEFYDTHRRERSLLYTDQVIYAPRVPVFRTDTGRWLADPFPVAFLTSAAPNRRMIERNTPEEAHRIPAALRSRAGGVLAVAAHHGHTRLVLGAWGCGVFGNHPSEVAGAFAHHLHGAFAGVFEHVVFAVLGDDDTARAPFRTAFDVPEPRPLPPGYCAGGRDWCPHPHRDSTANP
ncbi:TIGR02452 family protein [Nocardiopsis sediminis]|uniref:TIGR02452 family protein n=1 Tax=Nocardiopsis sediminis TaxID=1778267 RepID=A0ABV8FLI5_9ACTN